MTDSNHSRLPPAYGEEDGQADYVGLRYDLGFVLRAPRRHPWVTAGCLLFVLGVAAASSLVIKDLYQVNASILAQRDASIMSLTSGVAHGPDWDAPTRAARESIIRRDNLVAICKQTGMVDQYLANRSVLGRLRASISESLSGHKETREEVLEGLADTVEKRIWVTVGTEGLVSIGFTWTDKEMAFQVVQAAVQNFVEDRYTTEITNLGETISILEASAGKLNQDVEASLTDLERQERARPQPVPRRGPSRLAAPPKDEDLARLQGDLNVRRRALAELEESKQRRLAELTAQLAQKEAIYAPQHPDVVAIKQGIEALQQPRPTAEALRGEIKDLERQLTQRGSPTMPADAAALPGSDLYEPRFTTDPEDVRIDYARGRLRLLRDQYASVLNRLSAARQELATTQAAFKYRYSVITPPARPKGPAKPYTLLRILGGLIGGLALALFVTTAIDVRSGRIVEEWQLQRQLDLPVLASFNR